VQPEQNGAPPGTDSAAFSIWLNELLPAPKNVFGEEWVELYNAGDTTADLSGWKIDDVEGGSSPAAIPEGSSIAPGEVLWIPLNKAILNNSGDEVRLLRPDGSVADSFTYSSSKPDQSYSLHPLDNIWSDTLPPSPGAPNPVPTEEAAPADTEPDTATGATRPAATPPNRVLSANDADETTPPGSRLPARNPGNSSVHTGAAPGNSGANAAAPPAGLDPDSTVDGREIRQPASLQAGELIAAQPYIGTEAGQIYRYSPPPTATALPTATPQPTAQPALATDQPSAAAAQVRITRLIAGTLLLALAGILVFSEIRRQRDQEPVL
jgi:hypothetical protein